MSFKPNTILLHSEYIWSNSYSVLLCNTKRNWLSFHHSRTFLQGQEHTQLCWRIFPHPDAVISSTETLWILSGVSWRTVGRTSPGERDVLQAVKGAHSLGAQQSSRQLLLFCMQASEQILQGTQQSQAKDRGLLQDSHLLHYKVVLLLSFPFKI